MQNIILWFYMVVLLLSMPCQLLAAPAQKGGAVEDKGPVLARMGQVTLSVAEFQRLMNFSSKEVKKQLLTNPGLMNQKIQESILRKMVLAKARSAKWDERHDVAFLMQRAKEGILIENYLEYVAKPVDDFPDETLVRKIFQENKDKFNNPPSVNVAQIFLQYESNATEAAKQEVIKRAEQLLVRLKNKEADFATLAKKHSQHQASATRGGDMGWVEIPQLLPEIKKAVDDMKTGDLKGPVTSNQGVHILQLMSTKEATPKPYAEVRDSLVQLLLNKKIQENKDVYLKELFDKEPITIIDDSLLQLK